LESKLQLIENNNVLNNSNINNSSTTNNNNNNSNISLNVIPYQTYKKDKDNLNKEIENKKNEIKKLNDMNSKLKSRKNVLEKELKDQKEQLTDKIKILLEKSDNDEKLITAMKNELLKKGVNIGNYFEDATFNLNQEILKLRQQIKEKDKYINNLTAMLIPDKNNNVIINNQNNNVNNNNNNMDVDMNNIMNRLAQLELENKQLRNKSEETKISESLAKENAKLRMKIADLEDKLQNK
jgi:chromosome segregation ATPase